MKHVRITTALVFFIATLFSPPFVVAQEAAFISPNASVVNQDVPLMEPPVPNHIAEASTTMHFTQDIVTIPLVVGKAQLLTLPENCETIAIADPGVCDVVVQKKKEFLLIGKQTGVTNIFVWLEDGTTLQSEIIVRTDYEALRELLHQILPYEPNIAVHVAEQAVILDGYVEKETSVEVAQQVAETYVASRVASQPSEAAVVNLLKVGEAKQILLEVRIAEVSRSVSDDAGFDFRYVGDLFGTPFDFSSLDGGTPLYHSGAAATGFADALTVPSSNGSQGSMIGGLSWDNGAKSFAAGIDYIIAEGLGKIIARPNLMVRNGDEATFLAGGEFPIPVQQNDAVGIEWKDYGVKLTFTPHIDERDNITLILAPEVSVLDFAEAAVSLGGYSVPAVKVRKTETKVVLRDGESFYISGLINQSETDTFSRMPGISNVPILGEFFKKKELAKSETDLIVFVTPRIVSPMQKVQDKQFQSRERADMATALLDVQYEDDQAQSIVDVMEDVPFESDLQYDEQMMGMPPMGMGYPVPGSMDVPIDPEMMDMQPYMGAPMPIDVPPTEEIMTPTVVSYGDAVQYPDAQQMFMMQENYQGLETGAYGYSSGIESGQFEREQGDSMSSMTEHAYSGNRGFEQ